VQYKTTDYYAPEHERTILWNDPALAIPWPLAGEPAVQPTMTDKDRRGTPLGGAETFE
jgi:dTDP-4-dehydrorhamnose 3,5-epimerase